MGRYYPPSTARSRTRPQRCRRPGAIADQALLRGAGARGLRLPTIPEFVVAYLGILKNGSVVVPLNFLLKAGELEYHLADSGASVLITWSRVAAEAGRGTAAAGLDRIYAVGPGAAVGRPFEQLLAAVVPGQGPLVQTDPGDTAAIVYTSGTTGRPKGAELTHFQMYIERLHTGPDLRDPARRRGPHRLAPVPRIRPGDPGQLLSPLRGHHVASAAL
jgi:acyl-CoA synthetase (AMP-forming)/AMP-acid ligase II